MKSIVHEFKCLALAIGIAESYVSANLRLLRGSRIICRIIGSDLQIFQMPQTSRSSQWPKRIDDVGNTVCRDQLIVFSSYEFCELAGLPQQ